MKNETTIGAKQMAIAMNREVHSNSQDANNVYTTSQTVKAVFHNHLVNMETGENGIEKFIIGLLREREAHFAFGIENGALRQVAIAASLTTEDIYDAMQAIFTAGSIRYPFQSFKTYLSAFMWEKGLLGCIKQTKKEDCKRNTPEAIAKRKARMENELRLRGWTEKQIAAENITGIAYKPRYKWYLTTNPQEAKAIIASQEANA